jgi:hypothetical protein
MISRWVVESEVDFGSTVKVKPRRHISLKKKRLTSLSAGR